MSFNEKLALIYIKLITSFRLIVINVFLSALFKKKSEANKILINRDGAFGDSIVALPAINIIRQNYPDAQIDLLSVNDIGVSFKDLMIKEGTINTLFNIEKKKRKETLKKLKEESYDLFIQIPQNIGLYKSIRNILLVRFYLNIKNAFGWDAGRIKSFARSQKRHHTIVTNTQRYINRLKDNGLIGETTYPITSTSPINGRINDLIDNGETIAFLIGGKLQPKKWPLNHWVSLAKLIGKKQTIIIVGGEEDKADADYICSKVENTINLCGQLTLPELTYVFENIKIAVSLDTGAMHLCDSTNSKLVVLFSTRDLSNRWYPTNKNSIVIEKVLPCSFCFKTKCKDNICMSNILPNEVYSNMNALLLDKN